MKYFLLVVSLFVISTVSAKSPDGVSIEYSWNELLFESDLQINQHHFLYELARDKKYFEKIMAETQLDSKDRSILNLAVDTYKSNMNIKHVLFDYGVIPQTTSKVLAHEKIESNTTIEKAFSSFKPLYERIYWVKHNKRNKQWIKNLAPKLNQHGAEIQAELEQIFDAPLFTEKGHMISVVYKPGTKQGAYTSSRSMQSVINSTYEDFLDWYALEMVFHEISHANSFNRSSKLFKLIETVFKERGLESETGIWHPILFYTVGEVVKKVTSSQNPDYITYADRNDLYTGSWDYKEILIQYWKPYLEGKVTMKVALDNIAKKLQQRRKTA